MYKLVRYIILIILSIVFILFSLFDSKKIKDNPKKQKENKLILFIGIGLLISTIMALLLYLFG
ncbi:MAG: hypothetical protein J5505_03725 [Spirochaetaceae bacterium]|nr:hypothetical protein [Spirochaetaceae bacterium]